MKNLALTLGLLITIPSLALADKPSGVRQISTPFRHSTLSPERLANIGRRVDADIGAAVIPGAVLMIFKDGKKVYERVWGNRDPQIKAPMAVNSIFRIYSMSKPITTVVAMMLVEEGKLGLEEPLSKYIPAFADVKVGVEEKDDDGKMSLHLVAPRQPITIHDLMRHTSGITWGSFGDSLVKQAYIDADIYQGNFDNAEFAERIARLPLAYQPGSTWDYGYSVDILGRVIEVVGGKPLFAMMQERLLGPLGMNDTSFYVTDKAKQGRISEPFITDRSIGKNDEYFDPRHEQKWQSGGGGLVSTAADYARFLLMLRNGGTFDKKRYLSPKSLLLMTSNHIGPAAGITPGPDYLPGPGFGFGLGFAVRTEPGVSPQLGSVGEFTWSGVGGTNFWVDPREDLFVVFMMQSSTSQRVPYLMMLHNVIYGALENGLEYRPHGRAKLR